MPVRVACSTCGTQYRLDNSLAGKKVRCQECQDVFAVPKAIVLELAPVPRPEPMGDFDPLLDPEKAAAALLLAPDETLRQRPVPIDEPKQPPREPQRPRPAPVDELATPPHEPQPQPSPENGTTPGDASLGSKLLALFLPVFFIALVFWATPKQPNPRVQPGPRATPRKPAWQPLVGADRDVLLGIHRNQRRPLAEIPLPEPVEIKPAPVASATTYKLPEPIQAIRVGGGGRYLILHFPRVGKLAIFDVNVAKIVREIPVAGQDVPFAAGMNHLLVGESGTRKILRYELATGRLDRQGNLDLPDPAMDFRMGHASAGPLLVGYGRPGLRSVAFIDPATLETLQTPPGLNHILWGGPFWPGATGRMVGLKTFPGSVALLGLEGEKFEQREFRSRGTYLVPGPEDQFVYANSVGRFKRDAEEQPRSLLADLQIGIHNPAQVVLPAAHGPYHLNARAGNGTKGTIYLYQGDVREPIATVHNTPVCPIGRGTPWAALAPLAIEESIHWIPKAKLLVVVPPSRDELRLYPADPTGVLRFTSMPPPTASMGKTFGYTPTLEATHPPLTFRLDGAPSGMTVGPEGKVSWEVPWNYAGDVEVRLSAKDSTGREIDQTLSLIPVKTPGPGVEELDRWRKSIVVSQIQFNKGFPLPARPVAVEIRPPAISRATIPLPEPLASVCLGGGGRYLILHFPTSKTLGIFDVTAAKIVHTVTLKAQDLRFAAGMNDLLICDPATREVQRYRLSSGALEGTWKLTLPEGEIKSFCLGHASAGPLLVSIKDGEVALFDLAPSSEMKPEALARPAQSPSRRLIGLPNGRYLAGRTGELFTSSDEESVGALKILGPKLMVKATTSHPVAFAVPALDDRCVFLGGRGIATNLLSPHYGAKGTLQPTGEPLVAGRNLYLPGASGPYFFSVEKTTTGAGRIRWFVRDHEEPLGKYEPAEMVAFSSEGWKGLPVEQSFHLIPQAKLLIAIPESRDELRLFPADLDAVLEASDRDHFVFTSPANDRAHLGTTWTHQTTIRGKHGPLRYLVRSGSANVTVNEKGELRWEVPATVTFPVIEIEVMAQNAGGKGSQHIIRLDVLPPEEKVGR